MILLAQLLWMWVYGLLSVILLVIALLLLYRVFRKPRKRVVIRKRDEPRGRAGDVAIVDAPLDRPAFRDPLFAVAVILLLLPFFGSHLVLAFRPAESSGALQAAEGTPAQTISRPDGTQLHVESSGPSNGPTLILTHGWGLDTRAWNYAKRDLSDRFRVIAWDLPGLGQSTEPTSPKDYSLDKMAGDLGAVLDFAGRPAVLVGHSIGGMINLTYCRQHPEQLGTRVVGIVQVDTTYTNPVKTTSSSGFDTSMQKPLYEPLLHLTIGLSPLVHAMNWLSYHNGLMHVMAASSSFAGAETREQLDYAARRNYEPSPAVLARGMLAMFQWDATPVLPTVRVRTLILEGEQDSTTVPAASRHMSETMPVANMRSVDRAAHLGLLEQHKTYNEAIGQFAATCF